LQGAKAEVYTVVIVLAIVPVYKDSHNTMANLLVTEVCRLVEGAKA
jgi:hypothetical protein